MNFAALPAFHRFWRRSLGTLLCLGICIVAAASVAYSQDDNENSASTPWWTYTGQTTDEIVHTIQTRNARITDIRFDVNSGTYTVTYVQNAGTFAKQWWWYVGIDGATLGQVLTNNHARLISFQAYDIGGGNIRFAVAMIANTGADAKAWWYYAGLSPASITSLVNANNARLTSLQSYVSNGQTLYAVIMISNTGNDAKAWWWFFNTSPQTIGNTATANKARVLNVTSAGNGNFNAVLESCSRGCPGWAWYFGFDAPGLVSIARNNNDRLEMADGYPGCNSRCYVAAMIHDTWQPGQVTITYHQTGACNGFVDGLGQHFAGTNQAYVIFGIEDINNRAGTTDFAFDPSNLYVQQTTRRFFDSGLSIYRGILGPFASQATDVGAGQNIGYLAAAQGALVVSTSNPNGSVEANQTPYFLNYNSQSSDPPITLVKSDASQRSWPNTEDCSTIQLH
jgi:hypothetical protein